MSNHLHKYIESFRPKNQYIARCLFLLSITSILLLAACTIGEDTEIRQSLTPERFEFVEKVNFLGKEAKVVMDNQTGIKYLYIWDEHPYGGVAITRLWDK